MTITFEYLQGPERYVTVVFEGKVTDSELLTAWKNYLENDKWVPGCSYLYDLSAADLSTLTDDGIDALLIYLESFISSQEQYLKVEKIALYGAKPSSFGMSRIFDKMGSDILDSIMIFNDKQEALKWLNQ